EVPPFHSASASPTGYAPAERNSVLSTLMSLGVGQIKPPKWARPTCQKHALLQLAKHRAPTRFRLRVRNPCAQHLAIARRADAHRHQHALTHHCAAAPHLLVARVDDQVRILFRQRTLAPLGDLGVQLRGQRRHLALAYLQPAQRLGNGAHLARRNALDVHLQHGQHQRLLAALIALEQLGLELAVAVLGDHELQFAHPRLQRARLVAVAPAPPLRVAFVVIGPEKTRHLGFQHLLRHPLHHAPKKILASHPVLPAVQNLSILSLASHLCLPPCECRCANNILRSRRKWLAPCARPYSASTELYGLNPVGGAKVPDEALVLRLILSESNSVSPLNIDAIIFIVFDKLADQRHKLREIPRCRARSDRRVGAILRDSDNGFHTRCVGMIHEIPGAVLVKALFCCVLATY